MKSYRIRYNYSYLWLIFFVIFFFPIALILLMTGCSFEKGDVCYTVHYHGSRFWLGFWLLVFFPISFLLLILNGFSLEETRGTIIR